MNPATGAQTLVTQGGQLCYPFGIAAEADGSLLVTNYGDFSDGSTVVNCVYDFGALVRIDGGHPRPVDRVEERARVGQPVPQSARRGRRAGRPRARREPERRHRAVAVDPDHRGPGRRDAQHRDGPGRGAAAPGPDAGRRRGAERLHARRPGGRARLGGPPGGAQSILRQDKQLFNNPLGVAVVANRAPVAAVSASPGGRGAGPAGDLRRVRLERPRGAAAPLRVGPGRQRQLRDRRRHEPRRSRRPTRTRPRSRRACA